MSLDVIGCHWYDRHVTACNMPCFQVQGVMTILQQDEGPVQLGRCKVGSEGSQRQGADCLIGEANGKVFKPNFKRKSLTLLVNECVCLRPASVDLVRMVCNTTTCGSFTCGPSIMFNIVQQFCNFGLGTVDVLCDPGSDALWAFSS